MRNPNPVNLQTSEEVRKQGWQGETRDADGHLHRTHAPFASNEDIVWFVREALEHGETITIWPQPGAPALKGPGAADYERQEAICTEAAMSQWERSLKRADMSEKDRVRGAIEAYKRQAFAFSIAPPPPSTHVVGSEKDFHRAANALLNTLWQKVYSGSRTHEENWQEMDRQFPQARWLHDELKAARDRAALASEGQADA